MVTWLTRRGIYAIAMGDEAMQVLNLDAVRGRPPSWTQLESLDAARSIV